jgi:hypothetical protein
VKREFGGCGRKWSQSGSCPDGPKETTKYLRRESGSQGRRLSSKASEREAGMSLARDVLSETQVIAVRQLNSSLRNLMA